MKTFLIIYGAVSILIGYWLAKEAVKELKQTFKPAFYEDGIPRLFFTAVLLWPWWVLKGIIKAIFS